MQNIINQVFEIKNKTEKQGVDVISRNLKRLYDEFETMGYKIIDPIGKVYDERDTSITANIINDNATHISKVLKPIIFEFDGEQYKLIQKGIVIVE